MIISFIPVTFSCVIQERYCEEKLDVSHSEGSKGKNCVILAQVIIQIVPFPQYFLPIKFL